MEGNTLTYDIYFAGLSSALTEAQIHGPAAADENAAILHHLVSVSDWTGHGRLRGMLTYAPGQIDDFLAELHYVNVHSGAYPAGEIRGQIIETDEPMAPDAETLSRLRENILDRVRVTDVNPVASWEREAILGLDLELIEFGAAVRERIVRGLNTENVPPEISAVPDQSVTSGSTVGPIGLTVWDEGTPAEQLRLSASSSNAALIPVNQIVFGGAGEARTVLGIAESYPGGPLWRFVRADQVFGDALKGNGAGCWSSKGTVNREKSKMNSTRPGNVSTEFNRTEMNGRISLAAKRRKKRKSRGKNDERDKGMADESMARRLSGPRIEDGPGSRFFAPSARRRAHLSRKNRQGRFAAGIRLPSLPFCAFCAFSRQKLRPGATAVLSHPEAMKANGVCL